MARSSRFSFMISATAANEALVVLPSFSRSIALSATPAFMTYRRPTAASLIVSPVPRPPVRSSFDASLAEELDGMIEACLQHRRGPARILRRTEHDDRV
jgi:hypothetical protein